jgi:hypothetical protein
MNIAGFGRTLIRLSDISCDLELLAYLRRLFLSLQNDFSFRKTLYPRTGEVARQWQATSSRTDQRWYSSIPAIVGQALIFSIDRAHL